MLWPLLDIPAGGASTADPSEYSYSNGDLYSNDQELHAQKRPSSSHDDHEERKDGDRLQKKRKRDFVQGLVEKCTKLEEENKLMRMAIASVNISPGELEKKRDDRLNALKNIAAAFNDGDIIRVSDAIKHHCCQECTLITPSLFQELNGYFAIVKFFTVIMEAFPDALLQVSEIKSEDNGVISSRFNFSGTKVYNLPSDVLFRQWRSGADASHADVNLESVMAATTADNAALRSAGGAPTAERPTVKLAGHITLIFNDKNLVFRVIFVWNTTALIGQIFGQSGENLQSMSHFFTQALNQFKGQKPSVGHH